jgi:hypothetical protein
MSTEPSPIFTDVDYEKTGKQIGHLYLPHSVTRSAYGNIAIPVCVVKNGSGPTILLMAGNHGDEYEGQIVLTRLVRSVDSGAVQGRLIILPAINLPAAMAGARVSPLDQGNLNRSFPGDPAGGPTARIAHYLYTVIFPMCDGMQDLHSGGSSLDYMPFASMRLSGRPEHDGKLMAALEAFAPPIGLVWAYDIETSLAQGAANDLGLVNLSGEFGGRGAVSLDGIGIIEQGMPRFLDHFGVMELPRDAPAPPETGLMEVRDRDYYVLAPEAGLFEPSVRLGDTIGAGQPAGQVHFVDNPGRPAVPCHFKADGMVICQRAMGRVERGDCVFHLATDLEG